MGNLIKSKAIESKDSRESLSLIMSVTLASGAINKVAVKMRNMSETNSVVSISGASIEDYLISQLPEGASPTKDIMLQLFNSEAKAQVLASALNEANTIEFHKLDGTPIQLYTSGLHQREWKIGSNTTGIYFLSISFYSEPSKTALGEADAKANANVLAFLSSKYDMLAELEAKLKSKTAKV